ncbi:hypothetical protein ABHN11_09315 [Brevibacillus centrosporus]|uniref:Uncharacterized protein n=2 Tax=Brevibacillus centrosporus TaxID=54910 RepID=A0A1I3TSX4_9BACL|nr:hypothetical protein EDM55_13315 [Brevibacillus centrosporus]GED29701.1 hypothetical protein BCE02nite_08420 [Brevibacillus centrosporus]SFJ73573.1 hypothetical protein SAMN05518846_10572 [Brevibacillus centrosporus]
MQKARRALLVMGIVSGLLYGPAWGKWGVFVVAAQETANRYEVAGITNPQAFEAFYRKLQVWVAKGNKAAIANHVQYPLRVNKDGQSRLIATEKQFLAEYDRIMTEKVKQALLQQDVKNTFVNYQGVMVGNGELWLREKEKKFVIVAVNQ